MSLKDDGKFLSLVLRHKPEVIGLTPDAQGWVNVEDLVKLSKGRFTPERIQEIVRTNNKQRFTITPEGKIRANQGHSIAVDLGLAPKEPPKVLYHGTALRSLDAILREGLLKGTRQHVHLSPDVETARSVGQRHGSPVVLTVAALDMHEGGFLFYLSANGLWLTDHVPAKFLTHLV